MTTRALVASAMVGIPSIPGKACIAIRLIADAGGVVVGGRNSGSAFHLISAWLLLPLQRPTRGWGPLPGEIIGF